MSDVPFRENGMKRQTIRQYSISFKRQVITDLESGRFDSMESARVHYGIGGKATIQKWVRKYGKNHLLPKVVLVQKPNEPDQIRQLKHQVAELQRALGQTQVENLLNAEFLKIACRDLGCDVDAFACKPDAYQSVAQAVLLYNHHRLHQSLSYACPMAVHTAA